MNGASIGRLGWTAAVATVALFLVAAGFELLTPATSVPPEQQRVAWADVLYPLHAIAFSIVGALILTRRPENRIGWVACGIGVFTAVHRLTWSYAYHGVFARDGFLPGVDWMAWLSWWTWYPPFVLTLVVLPLLFPDGRLLSSRWRIVASLAVVGTALQFVAAVLGQSGTSGNVYIKNPFGIEASASTVETISGIAGPIPLVGLGLASISLVLRYRRAGREQRQQLKWFASAVVLLTIVLAAGVAYAFNVVHKPFYLVPVVAIPLALAFLALPAAIGIAVLKYRLYDIDLVINRALLLGFLATFITAAYVAIVAGIGALIGSSGKASLLLSILATALVAVAFQPVRERLQRLANRLVYGKRATPYEVLSRFSERISETYAAHELLPTMAQVLAEGTGATRATVWLRVGEQLRPVASWPPDRSPTEALSIAGDDASGIAGSRTLAVRHDGELLGAVSVEKRTGETLSPIEDKLLSDLARQASLVLRNVSLNAQLIVRLEELRASRQRLVAAQDEERRRLERDLHDGLQQELVAMLAKIRIARTQTARDPAVVDTTLEELQAEVRQALHDLRELARGIRPPVLSDRGLVKAIEARVVHMPIGVTLEAEDGLEEARYAEEVESAAYFFVCEGLANVMKHASTRQASVRLSRSNGSLEVQVLDAGTGFDVAKCSRSGLGGLKDRIEAVGGTFSVASRPGAGTRIVATLPARRASNG